METFNYFDGINHQQVFTINKLSELNQEEANLLATGPQDLFFEKLEALNFELQRKGVDKIDVTPAWNWRPGSYDKVKDYLTKRLWIDKKVTGMDRLFDRTVDRVNYMNYIKRQTRDMEFERANLKRLGVNKDVDVDKFLEDTKIYCDNLIKQCQNVFIATDEKVLIVPYVSEIVSRKPSLYLDITLSGLNMQIFSGAHLLEEIPMNNINLIHSQSLRHKLSGRRGDSSMLGTMLDTDNNYGVCHPYISNRRANWSPISAARNFGSVCFDKFTDDVYKALKTDDLLPASFQLLQWAQYYNVNHANPYNQPHFLHLGANKSLSEEYIATQSKGSILDHLSRTILKKSDYMEKEYNMTIIDKSEWIVNEFDHTDCRFKTESATYNIYKSRVDRLNNESWCVTEAVIMEIVNHLTESAKDIFTLEDINNDIERVTNTGFNYWLCCIDGDDTNIDWVRVKDNIKHILTNYFLNMTNDNGYCPFIIKYLQEIGILEGIVEKETDNDKMMRIMKHWANSSEGGR